MPPLFTRNDLVMPDLDNPIVLAISSALLLLILIFGCLPTIVRVMRIRRVKRSLGSLYSPFLLSLHTRTSDEQQGRRPDISDNHHCLTADTTMLTCKSSNPEQTAPDETVITRDEEIRRSMTGLDASRLDELARPAES
jgi:hypothetical protein